MMLARTAVTAFVAVTLSVGGFTLGKARAENIRAQALFSTPVAALAPADHPLSLVREAVMSGDSSAAEREKIVQLDRDYIKAVRQASRAALDNANRTIAQLRSELTKRQQALDLTQAKARGTASKEAELRIARQNEELTALHAKLAQIQSDLASQAQQKAVLQVDQMYSRIALKQVSPDVRHQVEVAAQSGRALDEERGFGLLLALRNRDDLGLTPRQVTKLQLLQANFITRFAPIREAYETRANPIEIRIVGTPTLPKIRFTPSKVSGTPYRITFDKPSPVQSGKSDIAFQIRVQEQPEKIDLKSADGTHFSAKSIELTAPKSGRADKASSSRWTVWQSTSDLNGRLAKLKAEIDGKAMSVLTDSQRTKLKRIIDQSLAVGK